MSSIGLKPALQTVAAISGLALLTAAFIPGVGDKVTSLFSASNNTPLVATSDGDGKNEDSTKVVEETTKNGAAITWTKHESDWSTDALVTYDQKWEKSFDVDAEGMLKLDIDQANVLVRPADKDGLVTVTMMRRVEAASLGKARKIFDDYKSRMSVNDEGFELTCGSKETKRPESIDRIVYRIAIPPKYNANVTLKSGDITIGELDGDVTTNTGFGATKIGHTKGNLKVVGRGGCVDITAGCDGGADVEGINADVYAANIDESSQLRLSGGNVWIGECKGEIYAQTSGGDITVQNVLGKVAGFALDGDVEVRLDKSPAADCRFGTTGGELNILVSTEVTATVRTTEEGVEGFEAVENEDTEGTMHERKLGGGGSVVSAKIDSGEFNFAVLELDEGASFSDESLGGSGVPEGLGGSGGLSNNTRDNFLTAREKFSDVPTAGKITNVALDQDGDMDGYSVYLPVSFHASEDMYPVLISLGGSWNVGKTIDSVNNWGLSRLVRDESDLSIERNRLLLDSFIIVAPHIKKGQYSDHPETIQHIIDTVADQYRGDTNRVYLTGLSRGGHGTWGLASAMPETFAAIAPVAGSTEFVDSFEPIAKTAVWIACNTGDGNYGETEAAIEKIEDLSDKKFLVVHDPDVSGTDYLEQRFVHTAPRRDHHDAWTELYIREEFYKWLLQQSIVKSSFDQPSNVEKAKEREHKLRRSLIEAALEEKKLNVTEAEVDAEIDRKKKAKLEWPEHWSIGELRKNVWTEVALKKLVSGQVTVTKDELQRAFESYFGSRVRVLAIVLSEYRQALDVWKLATDNPTRERFAQLSQQHSTESVPKDNQGKIPPIRRHGDHPELEEMAFGMKPDQISKVIQVGERWVILYCLGRTKSISDDFDSVKSELEENIREQKILVAGLAEYRRLRRRVKIEQ